MIDKKLEKFQSVLKKFRKTFLTQISEFGKTAGMGATCSHMNKLRYII